jgi:phosphate transport system permease protein
LSTWQERSSGRRHLAERGIESLLLLAALVSVFTTIAIVAILVWESILFFRTVPLFDFLTDRQWTPLFDDAHFGIVALLSGTLTTTVSPGGDSAGHHPGHLSFRVRSVPCS